MEGFHYFKGSDRRGSVGDFSEPSLYSSVLLERQSGMAGAQYPGKVRDIGDPVFLAGKESRAVQMLLDLIKNLLPKLQVVLLNGGKRVRCKPSPELALTECRSLGGELKG